MSVCDESLGSDRVELGRRTSSTPAHLAEAAHVISDIAALVRAGLVVVHEDPDGLARYGVSLGLGDPGGGADPRVGAVFTES